MGPAMRPPEGSQFVTDSETERVMNESLFIDALEASPGDRCVLQRYADWLIEHDDPRGEHLNAELGVYHAEDQLQIAIGRLTEFRSTRVQHFAWLNAVFPLQTKAPLAGTIYRSTGPDEPALVEVGAMVHSRSVVAIIEAQKVFYHVPAAHSGLVTEVLFKDRATVAVGDCLVQIIRPQKHEVTQQGDR